MDPSLFQKLEFINFDASVAAFSRSSAVGATGQSAALVCASVEPGSGQRAAKLAEPTALVPAPEAFG